MRRKLLVFLTLPLLAPGLWAQRLAVAKAPSGEKISYVVAEPKGYDAQKTYPVMLALPEGDITAESMLDQLQGGPREALRQGWVVVAPVKADATALGTLILSLRLTYRIESQRLFFLGGRRAALMAESHRTDLAHLLVLVLAGGKDWVEERILGGGTDIPFTICTEFGKDLLTARARLKPQNPAERAIAATLDDFHGCASIADGERYFGHFAPKGVFIGTDATERWTLAEFKAFGMQYFERDSAWIYVPQTRNIDVTGDFAWFDELLHSDSYGECRGTGALQNIDGVWKIAQYHLTVPVPNPLMRDVVAQIAAAQNGAKALGATTVIVVRHAEKKKAGNDPALTEEGRARAARLAKHLTSIDVTAAYATTYRRTQATITPCCKAKGVEVQVLDPRVDVARKILKENRGGTVLIGGHSNTVPDILRRLGVRKRITIDDDDYDNLFVVTIEPGGAVRLLHLEF